MTSTQNDSLHQVVCLSKAEIDITDDAVLKIQAVASMHNEERAVTGMLLIGGGYFLQVLEGDRAAVHETIGRNAIDPRHAMVTVLRSAPISERLFKFWNVGLINDDPPQDDFDFFDIMHDTDRAGKNAVTSDAATNMISAFEAGVKRLHAVLVSKQNRPGDPETHRLGA